MTEAEWLAGDDPLQMLAYMDADPAERRPLLLLGACLRRVWDVLPVTCRDWAEKTEAVAEGSLDLLALNEEWEEVEMFLATHDDVGRCYAVVNIAAAAWHVRLEYEEGDHSWRAERKEQAGLVRDLFGSPFRPVRLAPAFRTTSIQSLAQAAYDERQLPSGHLDPARLAVLSDALEEAGCTDGAILTHLRSPGPHVRGCWALDLALGKE